MALNRDLEPDKLRLIASGPGRLAEALAITRIRDNGKDLVSLESDLQIVNDGFKPKAIRETERIGITKSVDLPLRFSIAGSAFVSGKRLVE
jgi:DNA-3-methyladenine glycosylase